MRNSNRFLALILLTALLSLPVAAAPVADEDHRGLLEEARTWLSDAWSEMVSVVLPSQGSDPQPPAPRDLTRERGQGMDPNGSR